MGKLQSLSRSLAGKSFFHLAGIKPQIIRTKYKNGHSIIVSQYLQPAKHGKLPLRVKYMGEWFYGSAYTYLAARYGVSVEECVLTLIEEIQDKIKASSISFNPRYSAKSPRLFLSLKQVGDSLFV